MERRRRHGLAGQHGRGAEGDLEADEPEQRRAEAGEAGIAGPPGPREEACDGEQHEQRSDAVREMDEDGRGGDGGENAAEGEREVGDGEAGPDVAHHGPHQELAVDDQRRGESGASQARLVDVRRPGVTSA